MTKQKQNFIKIFPKTMYQELISNLSIKIISESREAFFSMVRYKKDFEDMR